MTTIRTAKNKGRAFERDCEYSLQQKYTDCYMTHEKGYILEYDLKCDSGKFVAECKRLKSISWNHAKEIFLKLSKNAPEGYGHYLLFKSNNQPCLVMYWGAYERVMIQEFDFCFGVPLLKHPSTKKVKA